MALPPIIPTGSSNSTTANTSLSSTVFHHIKERAFDLGFDHCAVTTPTLPDRDRKAYESWSDAGFAGSMAYMTKNREARSDVTLAYPTTRSVISLGISYYQGPFPEKPTAAYGRIARYAWGRDYHDVVVNRLADLIVAINELLGGNGHAISAMDTKPLLERALASSAGLGFVGKNTVLIVPRGTGFHIGSYIFLAEILLDIPLGDAPVFSGSLGGCGSCTKCLTACPTNAFEGPYRLNAERCIAYQTIENKGMIPREMRPSMGDWLFGCDVCQEVCPFNARAFETRWPEFKPEEGVGPWVSLSDIFHIANQAAFKEKWGHTPLSRPKRKGLVRNACIVAANSKCENLVPDIENLLLDGEPIIRAHALWALSQLMPRGAARNVAEKQLVIEQDEIVRAEGMALLNL
jgi:epoxyqueuosine reductase